MKHYCFDTSDAVEYGVFEAIMLHNLKHWISHNMANRQNQHDGRTWTYNSKQAFSKLFPFWSPDQVKRILNSLINQNAIITGNYNKKSFDRTLWYALSDEKSLLQPIGRNRLMERAESPNTLGEIAQPIPDINTDINKDLKHTSSKTDFDTRQTCRDVIDHLNLKTGRRYKSVETNAAMIRARLREGHSVADIMAVIDRQTRLWQDNPKMKQYLRPATLFNAEKFNCYVGEINEPISDDSGATTENATSRYFDIIRQRQNGNTRRTDRRDLRSDGNVVSIQVDSQLP